jgi:hypothetical protein
VTAPLFRFFFPIEYRVGCAAATGGCAAAAVGARLHCFVGLYVEQAQAKLSSLEAPVHEVGSGVE